MKGLFEKRTAAEQLEFEQKQEEERKIAQARKEAIAARKIESKAGEQRGCFSRLLEFLMGGDSTPAGPADTGHYRSGYHAASESHDFLGEKIARMRGW